MGFISDLAGNDRRSPERPFSGNDRGQAIWQQIFGSRTKEDTHKFPKVRPGGSFGRSVVSEPAAVKRLIQALRSMAPGGWSDDRWEQTRHFVGIQYVAIHRTAEMLSQAEFQVFIKDDSHPKGKRPIPKIHNGYELCHLMEKPNNQDSFGDMMYQWYQQLALTGMSLTWAVPNVLGYPYELYPIPTATAIPQPAINPDYPDGYYRIQPVYPYGPFSSYPTPSTAVGAPIPAQWMMRVKFPHPLLRYDGYAPLTALRMHIDEVEMIDRSRHSVMRREVRPSAVLNFKDVEGMQSLPEEEIERIRADMEADFQGPDNHGRLYVATPGGELAPWGSKAAEMEYQSGWDQLVSFVLGGLGITKPAAGMIEDASYSTLFATLKQFYELTLGPVCNRFSNRLTSFLGPFYGDDIIIEIRCKRIDDHDVTRGKIQTLIQAKAITKNEVREAMDLPITQESWGTEIAGEESQQGLLPGQGGEMPFPTPKPIGLAQGLGEAAPPVPGQGPGQPPLPRGNVNPGLIKGDELEPLDVVKSRPQPENLGRGALGPRKHLTNGRHR